MIYILCFSGGRGGGGEGSRGWGGPLSCSLSSSESSSPVGLHSVRLIDCSLSSSASSSCGLHSVHLVGFDRSHDLVLLLVRRRTLRRSGRRNRRPQSQNVSQQEEDWKFVTFDNKSHSEYSDMLKKRWHQRYFLPYVSHFSPGYYRVFNRHVCDQNKLKSGSLLCLVEFCMFVSVSRNFLTTHNRFYDFNIISAE